MPPFWSNCLDTRSFHDALEFNFMAVSGLREKFSILFEEPLLIQANQWYVAWARISGPSSDCGSSGQATVATDDQ